MFYEASNELGQGFLESVDKILIAIALSTRDGDDPLGAGRIYVRRCDLR